MNKVTAWITAIIAFGLSACGSISGSYNPVASPGSSPSPSPSPVISTSCRMSAEVPETALSDAYYIFTAYLTNDGATDAAVTSLTVAFYNSSGIEIASGTDGTGDAWDALITIPPNTTGTVSDRVSDNGLMSGIDIRTDLPGSIVKCSVLSWN
jgi:hypothetical protein